MPSQLSFTLATHSAQSADSVLPAAVLHRFLRSCDCSCVLAKFRFLAGAAAMFGTFGERAA